MRLERERKHLEQNLAGIKECRDCRMPCSWWTRTTRKLRCRKRASWEFPVVAIVDTNCDPDMVNYVIPGNDDALRAIRLFTSTIADSAAEGVNHAERQGLRRKKRRRGCGRGRRRRRREVAAIQRRAHRAKKSIWKRRWAAAFARRLRLWRRCWKRTK